MIRFTKRVARFVWRHLSPSFYSRIDKRIDLRLTQLDAGWKQHVPAFLNAVSTVKAFGVELTQSRKELREEMAQSQQELREEMAHLQEALTAELSAALVGTNGRAQAVQERSEPRIVSANKVTAARCEGLRLNLGCGLRPLEGYINVDTRALPCVDVIAEPGNLPFEPGSVKEIYSVHMLESFPQEQLVRHLLPYWRELLAPGGVFRTITHDAAAMLADVAQGSYPFDEFREAIFGTRECTGDVHHNMFTLDSLRQLLAEAGFTDIQTPMTGRRNGKGFEFEIRAIRQA